jgi:hypothetical protein
MIQLTAGIWKLGGIRRALKIGRCHLHLGEEDVTHIKSQEIKKWTEKLAYTGWVRSHTTPTG